MASLQVDQPGNDGDVNERTVLLSSESERSSTLNEVQRWSDISTPLSLMFYVVAIAVGLGLVIIAWPLRYHRVDEANPWPYTEFQGIGFQIYTGAAPAFLSDSQKNPECIGQYSYGDSDGEMQCYLGQSDPTHDVQKRLQIMYKAVDMAHELSDKNDTTLKIFLVPEFFWRGKDGAYLFDLEHVGCGCICEILHGLQYIVQQKRFKHWIFVFGTVVVSERVYGKGGEEEEYLFYNFAPVYKGFDPEETSFVGKRFIVPKRYVSKLDFLTPRRYFSHTKVKELVDEGRLIPSSENTIFNPYDFDRKMYDNEGWDAYREQLDQLGYTMINYGWFLMDNITFTLEICLDHDRQVALDAFMANLVTGAKTMIPSGDSGSNTITRSKIPAHQAQISLVSSAGMTVNEKSLVLAHGGSIFLQDGISNVSSTRIDRGEDGILFDGGTELVRRYAVLTPTDVYFDYELDTNFVKYPLYENEEELSESLNSTFSTMVYKPHIVVYNPVTISKV
jgi:hypothetical protein